MHDYAPETDSSSMDTSQETPAAAPARRSSLARLTVHVFQHLYPAYSAVDSPTLIVFVETFLTALPTKPTTVFLALKYLAAYVHSSRGRYQQAGQRHSTEVTVAPLLFLTSAISLADDFLHDQPFATGHYASATGLRRSSIVATKREICEALRWDLAVPKPVFGRWVAWLKAFAIREVATGSAGSAYIHRRTGKRIRSLDNGGVVVRRALFAAFRETQRVKGGQAALTA
ncbi:hypothetical protein HKX48_002449 [Thoreauomyces humboldtii]|nr:hypothetical protein HKX48_002449 [Thoreauomyces humboldtii]